MYRNSIIYMIMVVLILAIVFVPTTWFDKMIEHDVAGFRDKINAVLETENDSSEVDEKCDALQTDWNKHMRHWSFFVHHSVIDKVDLSICTLIDLVQVGNYESALMEARRLDKMLQMTEEQDELNLMNIF